MTRSRSRRDFLKLSGAAALGLAFRLPPANGAAAFDTPIGLGRVTNTVRRRDRPSSSGKALGLQRADDVLAIYEQKVGEDAEPAHNLIWFRVDDGWIHSSFVQPVHNDLNTPILEIPEGGFLAEVTVPFTQAWRNGDGHPTKAYRFYYSTTHWVDQAVTDDKDNVWYRVFDDRYQVYYYVLAEHLRRIPDEELTPLSPAATDKRLKVDLNQQHLTAYENGSPVFTARLSSGRKGSVTPTGTLRVERKRPSRHMAARDGGGNGFDLPGIPWVAYFYWSGVAFHGTYWHNDFGRPRSRGCVNLTPTDAKWIYRWTLPVVPPGEDYVRDKNGTQVIVF